LTEEEAEAAVEALLEQFNGDTAAVIKALVVDLEQLTRKFNASVSTGFVRSIGCESTIVRVNQLERL
jgi:hypothetical protein